MAYRVKWTHFFAAMAISGVALVLASACSSDDSPGGSGGNGATDAGGGSGGSGATGGGGSGGSRADGGGECAAPTVCRCEMDQSCTYSCAAGCTVECLGATCGADCAEGGCTLDADFGANATYTCSGGNCLTDCDNGAICGLDCSGGGCSVSCDLDSTCTVTCPASGPACDVTCANGGRATCEGNCSMTGCDSTCVPDPSYAPNIVPAQFSNVVDNPLFPLPVGAVWVYEGPGEVITVTVTNQAKTVMGVDCVVVHDEVRSPTGELIEDTLDWYAQHSDGSVWYFGEETAEYVNGQVATTAGSWEGGVDGALPGIIMQAAPTADQVYRQEYYACEAEDVARVVSLDESITVPTGSYTGCVNTRDYSPLDPTANEIKTYCPVVGLVQVKDVATGEVVETLTSVTMP